MIDVHLWVPDVVYTEQWRDKIDYCLDEIAKICIAIEIGSIKTHVRTEVFSTEQLAEVLEEAMFIPVIRQVHIVVLSDLDVLSLDHMRIVDHLVHIDSVARLTRRIQILACDVLSTQSHPPTVHWPIIKQGFQSISTVAGSKLFCVDLGSQQHKQEFIECEECTRAIHAALIVVFIKLINDNPMN